MNVIGNLACILAFVTVISMIDAINLRDKKNDQQFYDSSLADNSAKTKRPFCNAFTGCGKKRSFDSANSATNERQLYEKICIPVPLYQALLRATGRDNRQIVDRESTRDNAELDEYTYSYLDEKNSNSDERNQS